MNQIKMNEEVMSVTERERLDFLEALRITLLEDDYSGGAPLYAIRKNMTIGGIKIERVAAIAAYLFHIDESIRYAGRSGDGIYKFDDKKTNILDGRTPRVRRTKTPLSGQEQYSEATEEDDMSDIIKSGNF